MGALKRRESAVVTKSDRWRLVLSAPERVETIQSIYRMFIDERLTSGKIADSLNGQNIPTARGPEWSACCSGLWHPITIQNILRNPVYVGDLVWNRRTLAKFFRIGMDGALEERQDVDFRRTSHNSAEHWIRASGCHPAIVERQIWDIAQRML